MKSLGRLLEIAARARKRAFGVFSVEDVSRDVAVGTLDLTAGNVLLMRRRLCARPTARAEEAAAAASSLQLVSRGGSTRHKTTNTSSTLHKLLNARMEKPSRLLHPSSVVWWRRNTNVQPFHTCGAAAGAGGAITSPYVFCKLTQIP